MSKELIEAMDKAAKIAAVIGCDKNAVYTKTKEINRKNKENATAGTAADTAKLAGASPDDTITATAGGRFTGCGSSTASGAVSFTTTRPTAGIRRTARMMTGKHSGRYRRKGNQTMLKAEIDAKTETAKIQVTGSLGDVCVECIYLIRAIADEIADTDTRYLFCKDILQSVVTEMKKIENKEG